jgi:tetratricopeptide (TPR) repeat protein
VDDFTATHFSPDLLDALARGDLPPLVFANLLWNHLRAVCPECDAAMGEWLSRAGRALPGAPPADYGDAFARAEAAVTSGTDQLARDRFAARRDLAELRRTPAHDRARRIRRANARFRSPLLVDLLLEEVRALIHDDPRDALHYAALARLAAAKPPDEAPGVPERRVRAAAHYGNALRACGRLSDASEAFAEARATLQHHLLPDTLVHAELAALEGSLLKDRRRLPEAVIMISRAALLYRLGRDPLAAIRQLIKLAYTHYLAGDLDQAVAVNLDALTALAEHDQPRLTLWARQNHALFLCDAGDFNGARQLLHLAAPLYDRFTDHTILLRREWLRGRIARGLGELDRAAPFFQKALAGFRRLAIGYDAGLVLLDLAELHLAQGDSAAVKSLAGVLPPILAAADLHQEAAAALLLFEKAAAQEVVTAAMLAKLRSRISATRPAPCRRPS